MSIQRALYDISVYRGDTPTFKYQILDINDETGEETPVDITRHTIKAQVRYSTESPEVWFELPIVKSDPTNGVFKWTVTKEISEDLVPVGSGVVNQAIYDMQIELEGSVFTFAYGKFTVNHDITK